jgi:rubrerythrin
MRFSSVFVAMAAPFLLVSAAPAYKRAEAIDITVLNFALTLERLETEFYNQALAKFKNEDFLKAGFSTAEVPIEQFKAIAKHEQAHIDFLLEALKAVGAAPLEGCKFDFSSVLGDVATVAAVARVVEYVGVAAYAGAATLVVDKNILAAAASILTIESRHQSLLNVLNGGSAIPQSFDMAMTPSQVLALAGGFISGCDLGIPASPSLTITNKGAVTVGTKLEFQSSGIDAAVKAGQSLSCQMLANGELITQSLPIDNCVVPPNVNGPVLVYITNSPQPLQANLKNQCTSCQSAGPTLIFIDSQPEFLGQLARTGQPIKSDKTIDAGDATPKPGSSAPAPAAPGSPAPGSAAPGSAAPGSAAPGTPGSAAPGAPGSSTPGAPGSSTPGAPGSNPGASGSTPGGSGSKPVTGTPQPAQANALPAGVNLSTGLSAFDGAVVVLGWQTMPKDPNAAAPAVSGTTSGSASTTVSSSTVASTTSSAAPTTTA